ncbi:hypothetical protein GCM10028857_02180 [Salinarchaeum chitinilyticum]
MPGYDLHEPDYSGTTTDDWDAPQQEDFDADDLGRIADSFLLSASGFPPDAFGDLQLPVVEPSGELNENALQSAHGGAHSVDAIEGIDDETVQDVKALLETLSREAFDREIGE